MAEETTATTQQTGPRGPSGQIGNANPQAPPAEPFHRNASGAPVWREQSNDPRKQFKHAQREYRRQLAEKRVAELEAGPKKFRVALVGKKDKRQLRVLLRGQSVDSLVIGAHSPDEAVGKFARYNGMHGGQEFIKVLEEVA